MALLAQQKNLHWFLALFLITLVTILLFHSVLRGQGPFATGTLGQIMPVEKTGDTSAFLRDSLVQGYPYHAFAAEKIQKGEFPLWNNLIFAGTPFFGNGQSAVLSPLKAPFWWLGTYSSFILSLLLQFIIGGMGMYVLCRAFNWKLTSALIAALAFILSGQFLLRSTMNHMSAVMAWLPWLWWSIYQLHHSLKFRWLVLTVIFTAFTFFSGNFQIAVFCLGISLIWLLALFQKNHLYKRTWLFVAAIALGLALSAVQIIPNLETIKLSYRETKSLTWSQVLNPKNIFHFEKPNAKVLATAIDPKIIGVGANSSGPADFLEINLFIGPIAIILILFSFLDWKKRLWRINALISAAVLIIILFPGLKDLLAKIFPWLSVTSVWRMAFILLFSLSLLAGMGAEILRKFNKKFIGPIILAAVFILSLWQWQKVMPFSDKKTLYPNTDLITQIQNQTKTTSKLWPKDSGLDQFMLYDIPIILGYDSVYPKTYLELWQANSRVVKPNQLHATEVSENLLKVTGASLILTNKPLPEN